MTTAMKRSDGVGVGHYAVDRIIQKKKKKGVSYCRMNNAKVRINFPMKRNTAASISRSLQKLFDCCQRVFEGRGTTTVPCPADVQRLRCILDSMKAEDVGLSRELQFFKPKSYDLVEEGSCPIRVTSATVFKSKDFEICLFFLPANAVIPLHNHPEMTVFSKLLLGTMHIKSYDWVHPNIQLPSRLRLAKLKANTKLTAPCNASVLYPTTGGNIHEFRAITPCAMLDVLGPPYSKDNGRDCSHYKDYPYHQTLSLSDKEETPAKAVEEEDKGSYGWLEEIQIPKELEMEGIEYMGPPIRS